jgi:hypothetical protein
VALATGKQFNGSQCATRYQQLVDVKPKQVPWTDEEDDLLCRAVAKLGTSSFAAIAKLVGSRNRDQCRDHWQNQLDPMLSRGDWSPEEDRCLLQAVVSLTESDGSVRWREVSLTLDAKRPPFAVCAPIFIVVVSTNGSISSVVAVIQLLLEICPSKLLQRHQRSDLLGDKMEQALKILVPYNKLVNNESGWVICTTAAPRVIENHW